MALLAGLCIVAAAVAWTFRLDVKSDGRGGAVVLDRWTGTVTTCVVKLHSNYNPLEPQKLNCVADN